MDELAGADAASLEEKFRLLHERQEEQEARILAGVKQLLLEHGGGLQSRTGLYGNPVKVPMGEGAPNNYGTKAHRVPLSAPKVPPVVPSGIPFHVVTENHHDFGRGSRMRSAARSNGWKRSRGACHRLWFSCLYHSCKVSRLVQGPT